MLYTRILRKCTLFIFSKKKVTDIVYYFRFDNLKCHIKQNVLFASKYFINVLSVISESVK